MLDRLGFLLRKVRVVSAPLGGRREIRHSACFLAGAQKELFPGLDIWLSSEGTHIVRVPGSSPNATADSSFLLMYTLQAEMMWQVFGSLVPIRKTHN